MLSATLHARETTVKSTRDGPSTVCLQVPLAFAEIMNANLNTDGTGQVRSGQAGAGACIRFGRAGSGSDFDTDQSRSVYLVRLISIWYCNWFMLFKFMTLDMPDDSEGTR